MCRNEVPIRLCALRCVGRWPFAWLYLWEETPAGWCTTPNANKHNKTNKWSENIGTFDISSMLSSPLSKMMSLLESLFDGLSGKKRKRMWRMSSWRSKSCFGGKIKNVQKRGTKDIFFIIVVIILIITGLASAAPCAGGPLNGGGPLDWAGQGGRRSDVLHVVRQAELVEALRCIFALWRLVGWAQRLGAVGVAQHACGGQFVPLDPRVVITDDILVVQPRQQRHLAFDPSELLTGWVHLDAFHRVVTTV